MSLTFSIAAPQSLTLPDGQTVQFCVNPADSSLVELHIVVDGGTHVLTFKRNGGAHDTAFFPVERQTNQPPYKSVDDDAVRDSKTREVNPGPYGDAKIPALKTAGSPDPKPLGGEKVDPVHGKITTAGADAQAGKPREARPEDASNADRAERAGVGMPPQATPDRGYTTPVDSKPAA